MKSKKKKNKKEEKVVYIIIAVVFGILFCIFKLFSFGWLSLMNFFPLVLYLIFYIIYGVKFAILKNKIKNDFWFFWLISFFFLLSGLLFVDFGDYGPPSQIVKFILYNVSQGISTLSIVTTITLMIISIISRKERKN